MITEDYVSFETTKLLKEYEDVDLEKEIETSIRLLNGLHTLEDNKNWYKGRYEELKELARHFYELGKTVNDMDKIEKIYQEIERLKKYAEESKKEWINEGYTQNAFAEDCRITSFDGLLSFIDTLSEEPVCLDDGGAPSKQKCGDCTIACDAKVEEDRDVVFWKGMQYAIKGMKEDAVDGIYTKSMDGKNVFVESGALKIDPASVKVGDPVKLIIIKDDGKSD